MEPYTKLSTAPDLPWVRAVADYYGKQDGYKAGDYIAVTVSPCPEPVTSSKTLHGIAQACRYCWPNGRVMVAVYRCKTDGTTDRRRSTLVYK